MRIVQVGLDSGISPPQTPTWIMCTFLRPITLEQAVLGEKNKSLVLQSWVLFYTRRVWGCCCGEQHLGEGRTHASESTVMMELVRQPALLHWKKAVGKVRSGEGPMLTHYLGMSCGFLNIFSSRKSSFPNSLCKPCIYTFLLYYMKALDWLIPCPR